MLTVPAADLKYTYSPQHQPVAKVAADEVFAINTADCFTGRYNDPRDFSPETIDWVEHNLNPVTGPVHVAGAEPGGAVEVTIHEIELISPAIVVVSRCTARSPLDWWAEEDHVRTLKIADGRIQLRDDWHVPAHPIIGCLATAPERETILSRREADEFGGNMDCRAVTAGATLTLPVNVEGALLYFGDVKAAVSAGEVVCAPEIGARITVSARPVTRPPGMNVPRVRAGDELTTIASDIDLATACRRAFAELKVWLQHEWALSADDAVTLMGIAAHCGVAQVSNQLHTGFASFDLANLPGRRRA